MRLGYCCAIPGVVKANRPTAAKAKATMRCSIESYKVLCFVEASLGRGNDRQQEVWLPAVKRSVFRRPENGGRRHIDLSGTWHVTRCLVRSDEVCFWVNRKIEERSGFGA
jgi:hypothetical protein